MAMDPATMIAVPTCQSCFFGDDGLMSMGLDRSAQQSIHALKLRESQNRLARAAHLLAHRCLHPVPVAQRQVRRQRPPPPHVVVVVAAARVLLILPHRRHTGVAAVARALER